MLDNWIVREDIYNYMEHLMNNCTNRQSKIIISCILAVTLCYYCPLKYVKLRTPPACRSYRSYTCILQRKFCKFQRFTAPPEILVSNFVHGRFAWELYYLIETAYSIMLNSYNIKGWWFYMFYALIFANIHALDVHAIVPMI